MSTLGEQSAEVNVACTELAGLKGWSLEEAWEKAEKAAGILQLSDPVQGLIFTLEAARVEARQKAECSSV